jgi:hypothetical protein
MSVEIAHIRHVGLFTYVEQPELFNAIVRGFLREDHRS